VKQWPLRDDEEFDFIPKYDAMKTSEELTKKYGTRDEVKNKHFSILAFSRTNMELEAPLVVVTGATGFLAGHIIEQLLGLDFRVRGTTRNPNDRAKTEHLFNFAQAHNLEIVKADLDDPEGCKVKKEPPLV
jgi:hypothetical protein